MAVSILHILLDFGVGLFPLQGKLTPVVIALLLFITLIQFWWGFSLLAGGRGLGSGVLSAVFLGLGWTLMPNGYSIVYCPPLCQVAAPLSDVAHIGSLVLEIAAPTAGVWTLLRGKVRVGWVLPVGALVLVVTTIWLLATATAP